jgi:hypothetical protein
MSLNETEPRVGEPAAAAEAGPAPASKPPILPKPPREPLYFAVILLLIADVVLGLGIAVFAEKVMAFRPMAVGGLGLATLGLGILAYFVLFGGGRAKR